MLKLGFQSLSSEDNNEIINRNKIDREEVFFLGKANTKTRTMIWDKISEISDKISNYYFSENSKLIALPNQIKLPKNICVKGARNQEKLYKRFLDQHCENYLHNQLVNALINEEAYVELGFQSENILKFLLDKAKVLRKKNKFLELNEHELKVLRILKEEMKEEDLQKCVSLHKKWRSNIDQEMPLDSYLFKEECLIN